MGKWVAGIAASVIAALIVWQVIEILDKPDPSTPTLKVTAWSTPEEVDIGKTMEIFVKVLEEDDTPVPDASVQLTPTSGSFLWAASGTDPIRGATDSNGLYSMTFQTVLHVGIIGGDPPPANSETGTISILVRQDGYEDGHAELTVKASD
jgi:hypothetical protein